MARRNIWSTFAALGIMAVTAQPVSAYTILPPSSDIAGRSIAEWTAAWWTWALQAPAATNPLTDPTGAFAGVNNTGPVFFIASTNGLSGPAVRSFDVPAGKPVLVPLLPFSDLEAVGFSSGTSFAERQAAANATVAQWLGSVNAASLFASVDGSPVANLTEHLEVTDIFSAGPTQPGSYAEAVGIPAGVELSPAKAAGYWLMIADLAPGPHTLRFGGSSNAVASAGIPAFSSEVTDTVLVGPSASVPEPASALLALPGLTGLLALRRTRRQRVLG
ncbi:MAG TPA: hypothetical protein VGC80_16365 [Acetobacteraceae bacterium]|jgi:hypothetical protein